jgi:enoyl-CoA hydratase
MSPLVMSPSLVLFARLEPTIGVITLNDPDHLNAMSEAMADQFSALVEKVRKEAGLRALILTGAGRAFSAGGDLEMLERKRKLSGAENKRKMLEFYDSFLKILTLKVPVVAALNGAAIGAGLCLASACDMRVAATGSKLGFTFARLGLYPGMGATYFLPRVIGVARASELLMTAKVILAEEALAIGLVSKVVAADAIMESALGLAREIAECGPQAIRELVQGLREGSSTLKLALEREATCQSYDYAGKEFAEGIAAVREGRKAKF